MEENTELNDIILNKNGSGSKSKKLLLAIATLTLVLIVVLVIMNALKSERNEFLQAPVPSEASAPAEVIDDPIFEPVELIEEESNATQADLGQIANKIKEESLGKAPATAPESKAEPKPAPKQVAVPVVTAPKTSVRTAAPQPAAKTASPSGTHYYIQVGVFSKGPGQALFDRLNASGLQYKTVPSGSATKVLVGPFPSEQAARGKLETVRKNVESGAYIVKG